MKLFALTFALNVLLFSNLSFSQISGFVYDQKSHKPIELALVKVSKWHSYTDNKGFFELSASYENLSKDTISFIALGYDTLKISVQNFSLLKNKKVYLIENQALIETIIVKPQRVKNKITLGRRREIGVFSKELAYTYSLKGLQGYKHVDFFENPQQEVGIIEKVFIYLLKKNATTFDHSSQKKIKPKYPKSLKIRLRFFSVKNNIPYKDLTNENIIIEISKYKSQWIDVSKYNIPFPKEGLFFGWELIDYQAEPNSSDEVNMPVFKNKDKAISFHSKMDKWQKTKNNFGFQIKVSYYE